MTTLIGMEAVSWFLQLDSTVTAKRDTWPHKEAPCTTLFSSGGVCWHDLPGAKWGVFERLIFADTFISGWVGPAMNFRGDDVTYACPDTGVCVMFHRTGLLAVQLDEFERHCSSHAAVLRALELIKEQEENPTPHRRTLCIVHEDRGILARGEDSYVEGEGYKLTLTKSIPDSAHFHCVDQDNRDVFHHVSHFIGCESGDTVTIDGVSYELVARKGISAGFSVAIALENEPSVHGLDKIEAGWLQAYAKAQRLLHNHRREMRQLERDMSNVAIHSAAAE